MGIIADSIKQKLEKAFNPSQLEVQDQSYLHAGHGGAAEHSAAFPEKDMTDETHIHVIITSEAFAGLSRLAKHRAVLDELSDEIDRLHAISLDARVER